jgi:uncharacterized protein YbbK (DUF523 family)
VKYIVSACLAGVACRYDGRHCRDEIVVSLVGRGRALPACPEQLGGLPTPRPPAEFRNGDGRKVLAGAAEVADQAGRTVTGHYLRGAIECARLAKTFGASGAILKDRSPSCGLRKVYVDGRLRGGRGVAAALLESEGLKLVSLAALKKLTGSGDPPRR